MRPFVLLFPLSSSSFSVHALAGEMKFAEHNFSVEMPSGWMSINPASRDALLAVQSASKTQKFLVFATKIQSLVHPDAGRDVRNDTKDKDDEGRIQDRPGPGHDPGGDAVCGLVLRRPLLPSDAAARSPTTP